MSFKNGSLIHFESIDENILRKLFFHDDIHGCWSKIELNCFRNEIEIRTIDDI